MPDIKYRAFLFNYNIKYLSGLYTVIISFSLAANTSSIFFTNLS